MISPARHSGSTDKSIIVWQAKMQRMMHVLLGHRDIVYALCVVGPKVLLSSARLGRMYGRVHVRIQYQAARQDA